MGDGRIRVEWGFWFTLEMQPCKAGCYCVNNTATQVIRRTCCFVWKTALTIPGGGGVVKRDVSPKAEISPQCGLRLPWLFTIYLMRRLKTSQRHKKKQIASHLLVINSSISASFSATMSSVASLWWALLLQQHKTCIRHHNMVIAPVDYGQFD